MEYIVISRKNIGHGDLMGGKSYGSEAVNLLGRGNFPWGFSDLPIFCEGDLSRAMQQEPIYWRYRFHICLAYFLGLIFREYPHKIWPTIWY